MHRFLKILVEVWSILLYPMLMPLYGMLMFCIGVRKIGVELPLLYTLLCIVGTLVLTVIIPVILLLMMKKKGYISSLHIEDSKQRTTPYIYTLVCYAFWAYFIRGVVQLPVFVLVIVLGAMVALLSVTIINHWWKISAHLTGIGGLLGGVCSFGLYYNTLPFWIIIGLLLVSLILMYARLYLESHTPMQVVCGFLLGLLTTFVPNLIMVYA